MGGGAGNLSSGFPHREGRTEMVLPVRPKLGSQGPRSKGSSSVFYNPAMSGSRTRSVLLLKYAIEKGMLGEREIYALDGLAASGLRARRWINELPGEMAKRISATIVDIDEEALKWAIESHDRFGTSHGEGLLISRNSDLRVEVLKSGRHWVDIDPYGSPAPFIDSAIQSMARSGVMEISATDTAALTGSSGKALMRRYGARVRTDGLAHDSGMRVMLASISRSAARHDRIISPLLSVWDSHHLRVSFRIMKSVSRANDLEESLGWRIYSPRKEEVLASIDEGLHPQSQLTHLPMHCMLPLSYPVDRDDSRVSGPLWVGPTGDSEAMSCMTESLALETCGPIFELEDFVGWDQKEFEMERRRISKSVRHISGESVVVGSNHLIVVDDLSSWLENGAPPSPRRIVSELTEVGHLAAVSSYGRPSFRTNAPWEAIVEAAELIQPPM